MRILAVVFFALNFGRGGKSSGMVLSRSILHTAAFNWS